MGLKFVRFQNLLTQCTYLFILIYYSPKGSAFPLQNTTTKENETLMAIGTAYVQGEDVAARGRVLLFSFTKSENSQNLVLQGSIIGIL